MAALAAGAVDLETLVMPGAVVSGHADVEADCGRCHQPFDAAAQQALCLDCHAPVAKDRSANRGFHGRSRAARQGDCRECHAEHLGRDADITGLDAETFDHDLTDYRLEGAHATVACADCHAPDAAYREAPGRCVDCHDDDDVHRGALGNACSDCHTVRAWDETGFDHDATKFSLVGRHRKVECSLCHPNERFEATSMDCGTCHRLDDVHRGNFGDRCETCHSPRDWARTTFDHDRETDYPLKGAHRRAKCTACHEGALYEEELETTCYACHRADDDHRGANGTRCDRCHTTETWATVTFDHDDTDFPLRGAHRDARCGSCHRRDPYREELDTSCYACHAGNDAHRGQEGKRCEQCHGESAWAGEVFFDHELVRFPLLGLHAVAACEQCHTSARFKDAQPACRACHRADDVHEARLGPSCERCHTPNGWEVWRFDHDVSTSFPLEGGHEGLECHACHRTPVREDVRLASSCESCHARDDAHRGAFGRDCGRCHVAASWDETRFGP